MHATKQAQHIYSEVLSQKPFEIKVSPTTQYGYFEHDTRGDECGGGLWFGGDDGRELTDYDGVISLPTIVCKALTAAGYTVEADFWPSGIVGQ